MKKLILIIAVLLTGCGSNENIENSKTPQTLAEQRCEIAKTHFIQGSNPIGIFITFKIEQNGIEYEVLTDGNNCIEAEKSCSDTNSCVQTFAKYSASN